MEASHASSTSRSVLISDALRKYKIIVGYLVFVAMLVGVFIAKDRLLQCSLAVGGIVVLWTLEPIPYHVASFVPLVVFPLSNLIPAKEVAMRYMNDDIIRALSGLFISILLQTSKLNRRMALYLLLAVGTSVRWLLLVYMWLVFLFAMFVTDAAVTAIMISLVDTLVAEVYASKVRVRVVKLNKANEEARLKQQQAAAAAGAEQEARAALEGQDIAPYADYDHVLHEEQTHCAILRKAFMLALSYAAVSGTAVLLANRPCFILEALLLDQYNYGISLTKWVAVNAAFGLVTLVFGWLFVFYTFLRKYDEDGAEDSTAAKEVCRSKLEQLGEMTLNEMTVTGLFFLCLALWVTRQPHIIHGWQDHLGLRLVSESTVGFFVVILAFLLPSDFHNFELKNRILKWNDVYHKMPWGVIFVMSGNIAISYALGECGVFRALMDWSRQLSANAVWAELFFLFLTSIASEVTTVKDRLPEFYYIAGNVSQLTDMHPLRLMLPVSAASEFNYMMPSSGARNAIIFEISYISALEMILPGLLMKIVSCFLYLGILNSVGDIMMGDEVLAVVNTTIAATVASTSSASVSVSARSLLFDNKL
ncbi:sodium-dependent dicarboxylate transporter SdcS-like [Dermacentor albipictus]|uniref:sodium-dependent dicarboxylate transporter SdcS-like n=1 Tax=Dermacentor albipictus TaxID=60249 RepID=UPI0031FE0225